MLQQLSTSEFFFMSENVTHCHFVLLMALISAHMFWVHKNGNIIALMSLFNSQTEIDLTWNKGEMHITEEISERWTQSFGSK